MIKLLLTYDVKKTSDTVHTELKKCLVETYKWSSQILSDKGNWYELPNTTLRKEGITREIADKEFLAACYSVGAKWERYLIAEFSVASFNTQKV